jgi:ribonuclease J
MRVRIHRGAAEIGGSCIELEAASGARILLDLGMPLVEDADSLTLPAVRGLDTGDDPSLLGVIISHPHQDHWGKVGLAHPNVPIIVGRAAADILRAGLFFGTGIDLSPAAFLEHRRPLSLGPFTVTPFLNDHSAYDAYSLLVEADGRRVFYTGDIRAHGRKGKLFDQLLANPPPDIDVLLMEGTNVPPAGEAPRPVVTESELEDDLTLAFADTPGLVLAAFSAQNIDRLVTVYRAALRAGRELVIDLYAATIAEATGRDSIPKPGFDKLRVFVPHQQKVRVKRASAFDRVDRIKRYRIFPDELRDRRAELVLLFRASMVNDLERAKCLEDARLVWSQWAGYLDQDRDGVRDFAARHDIPLDVQHTSGHASIADLRRLATALAPQRVVPIHTFGSERFASHFDNVERHPDGVWWDV